MAPRRGRRRGPRRGHPADRPSSRARGRRSKGQRRYGLEHPVRVRQLGRARRHRQHADVRRPGLQRHRLGQAPRGAGRHAWLADGQLARGARLQRLEPRRKLARVRRRLRHQVGRRVPAARPGRPGSRTSGKRPVGAGTTRTLTAGGGTSGRRRAGSARSALRRVAGRTTTGDRTSVRRRTGGETTARGRRGTASELARGRPRAEGLAAGAALRPVGAGRRGHRRHLGAVAAADDRHGQLADRARARAERTRPSNPNRRRDDGIRPTGRRRRRDGQRRPESRWIRRSGGASRVPAPTAPTGPSKMSPTATGRSKTSPTVTGPSRSTRRWTGASNCGTSSGRSARRPPRSGSASSRAPGSARSARRPPGARRATAGATPATGGGAGRARTVTGWPTARHAASVPRTSSRSGRSGQLPRRAAASGVATAPRR